MSSGHTSAGQYPQQQRPHCACLQLSSITFYMYMKFKIIITYTQSQTLKVTTVIQESHCVDKCHASLTTSVSFLSTERFPHFQGPSRIVHMWWQQRQYKHMLLASCILRTATNKKHIQNLATHKEGKPFHGNYLFLVNNSLWPLTT